MPTVSDSLLTSCSFLTFQRLHRLILDLPPSSSSYSWLFTGACGCAGCFTATNTLPLLAHVFEAEGALDRLEGFASRHGPAFYRLPENAARLRLVKRAEPAVFAEKILTGAGPVTVFDPGFPVYWHVQD